MKAKDIMTTDVITVQKNSSIRDAAQKMAEADVGSVIVNDDDAIVGIITDRDITIRGLALHDDINSVTCNDIMSEDVVTVDSDTNMEDVIELMSDYQIKRIPITEGSDIIGIVSLRDISQSLQWEEEAGEVLNDITKPEKKDPTY